MSKEKKKSGRVIKQEGKKRIDQTRKKRRE